MNRRQFLLRAGIASAALAVPELWVSKQTIFLPPSGGWVSRRAGWQMLENGLIVQWGVGHIQEPFRPASFPVAFPGEVFSYTRDERRNVWCAIGYDPTASLRVHPELLT